MQTEGISIKTPSIAAATVPEYITSSPMFGPWFIPEKHNRIFP